MLIPPHKHHDHDHDHDGGDGDDSTGEGEGDVDEDGDSVIDLDDLKARLESYFDDIPDRESDEFFTSEDL